MSFVHDAWYAAGWTAELDERAHAITVLDQPIVLFRTAADGRLNALSDACPHRFAPLSLGTLLPDRIVCPYHGLQFGGSGACLHNPHGKGAVPQSLAVRSWPVAERYGMAWVWMGDAAAADHALPPPLAAMEDPALSWIYGELVVDANYQLVLDNLLDLTHVEFLHPMLASPGNAARTRYRCEQEGDRVSMYYDVADEPITGLFQILWDNPATTAGLHAYMHWHAPSNLYLDTGMISDEPDGGPKIPTVHLLVPEGADRTRYYWAAGRNRQHGNDQVSNMLRFATQNAFENEDEPMIRAVRSRMSSNDLLAHSPALLPMDEAAVRARRIIARRAT